MGSAYALNGCGKRRPKGFIDNGAIDYVLVSAVSILLLFVLVIGIFLDAAWLLNCSLLIASDIVRSVRWRRDYEVSLCRLIHTMRPPESI